MTSPISIKPHHFVDILTSFGAGQIEFHPHSYGHALHLVATAVLQDADLTLRIELGADDICTPCKHNTGGACDDTIDTSFRPTAPRSKGEWNLRIDRRWCERLKVEPGDTLTARELCRRIQDALGHLADLYREIPADRVKDREVKLRLGIRSFLR